MDFNRAISDIERAAFVYGMLQLAVVAVMFWVLYLVVKAAVKDGINESRLGKQSSKEPSLARENRENMPPLEL